jgi:hypothetical protein
MKIQILAHDGKILETIEEVHINLKSQGGIGSLMDKILEVYKDKYSKYMYEQYKLERRSGTDRRHDGQEDRRANK